MTDEGMRLGLYMAFGFVSWFIALLAWLLWPDALPTIEALHPLLSVVWHFGLLWAGIAAILLSACFLVRQFILWWVSDEL